MKFSTAALVALSALPLAFAQDSVDECEPPSVHRPGHHQQLSCRNPKDLNPVDVIPITEGFDGKIFTVDVVPRQGSVLVPAPNITTISYPELGFPDYYNDAMPVNVILSTTLVPSRAELSEDGTLAFLEYTLQGLRAWSMELGNIPVEDCFGLGGNPRLEFSNVTRRSLFDDTKDPQNIKWSLEVSEGLEILRPTTQYWEDFIVCHVQESSNGAWVDHLLYRTNIALQNVPDRNWCYPVDLVAVHVKEADFKSAAGPASSVEFAATLVGALVVSVALMMM